MFQIANETRICAHCGGPMRGVASLTRDGEQHWLCHPDDGIDCYFRVTVLGHALDCACPHKPSRDGLEPHQRWVWMAGATPPRWEIKGTGVVLP